MTRHPISYQNGGKMAKIDTLFITKTSKTTISFGAAHTYTTHTREYSPRGLKFFGQGRNNSALIIKTLLNSSLVEAY